MTIEQALIEHLIDEIDGVGGRVYPAVFPEDVVFPALRIQRISGAPAVHHCGDSGEERARVQVSCYAKTYSEAKAVAQAVRASLSAVNGAMGSLAQATTFIKNETDLYEAETRLHHVALDVDVFTNTLNEVT